MDFSPHNIQRMAQAITTCNSHIDDPCLSIWNKNNLSLLKTKKAEYFNALSTVIDRMGEASAKVSNPMEKLIMF